MIVSTELLTSLKESQGMQVGVEASHALRSGTSPNPAVGVKPEESSSLGFFALFLPFSPSRAAALCDVVHFLQIPHH